MYKISRGSNTFFPHCILIDLFMFFSLCTLTGPYTLTPSAHSPGPPQSHAHSIFCSLTHNKHIHLYWLYTHTHTHSHTSCCYSVYLISFCLLTLPLYISTSITPVLLQIVKSIGTAPAYSMLTYLLCSYFSCFFSSITLFLIIALLGFEFARKSCHCTCACDIKTLNFSKWQKIEKLG